MRDLGEDNIEMEVKEMGYALDSNGSEQGQMDSSCEHNYEPSS